MSALGSFLLAATLATPTAFLAACFVPRWRDGALAWQGLAPIPALVAALAALAAGPFDLEVPALRLALRPVSYTHLTLPTIA